MRIKSPSIQTSLPETNSSEIQRYVDAAAAIKSRSKLVNRRSLARQLGCPIEKVYDFLRKYPEQNAALGVTHGNFQGSFQAPTCHQEQRAHRIADMMQRANQLRREAFLRPRPLPAFKEVTTHNLRAHQRRAERAHELRSLLNRTREELIPE